MRHDCQFVFLNHLVLSLPLVENIKPIDTSLLVYFRCQSNESIK